MTAPARPARRIATLLLAAQVIAGGAMAASPAPTGDAKKPEDAQRQLQDVERDLKAGEARRGELDAQAEALEAELASLRAALIAAADEFRVRETELTGLEARLAGLGDEEKRRVARIEADRAALGELLGALQRLTRLPPEAMIARPEPPADTIKSALLLRAAVPELRARADSLSRELADLATLRTELAGRRTELGAAQAALASKRTEIATLVQRREALARRTLAEREQVEARLARLAGRATDLKELIERLEADRKAEAEKRRAAEEARRAFAEVERERRARDQVAALKRAPTPPKSNGLLLPSGDVLTRYGEADGFGGTSRGISYRARAGGAVVAPADGEILFAGPFKGYGLILIVQHTDGYHSLLAGLGRIDAQAGQRVLMGEPLGAMADSGDPTLYFELRRDGQPINPLRGLKASDGKGQG